MKILQQKLLLLTATSLLVSFSISYAQGLNKVTRSSAKPQVHSRYNAIMTTTLIVSYKNNISNQTILKFEQSLPKHVKKSLNSKFIFSYNFQTLEISNKAKALFSNASIISDVSQDRIFKLDAGYGQEVKYTQQ